MQDAIGNRGEALFYTLITRFYGPSLPRFRPQFLGAKFTTVDFLVELVDADAMTPFFFVQVKTTRQGYTQRNHRLKIQVVSEDIQRLIAYPAPTYVVGIDERNETGYISAILERHARRIASLSTAFPLDQAALDRLWQEVYTFWSNRDMRFTASHFVD
ncbi:MAG: DUF4365 domain-containing protein [Chloroflexaceae bacterium]